MNRIAALIALCLFWPLASPAQETPVVMHVVQEGEDLAGLAARYFGDPELAREILLFNDIKNPNDVRPGRTLLMAVNMRADALRALADAERAVDRALDAKADVFAVELFEHASTLLASARRSLSQAAYDQTSARATLAAQTAVRAVAEADRVAPVQDPVKIIAVHGAVEALLPMHQDWRAVAPGEELPALSRIRAGPGARADIALADNSRLQLQENTEFLVADQTRDRRDEKRTTRLSILMGDLVGEIAPRGNTNSTFHLDSVGAVTAIRGTQLRLGADAARAVRLSIFEGLAEISAAGATQTIPDRFGTFVRENRPPAPPIQLPGAPALDVPRAHLTTAVQRITLDWSASPDGPAPHSYRVEIARDPRFNRIVQEARADRPPWKSDTLEPGAYHWRVSGVDRNGLQGPPSDERPIRIVRDLRIGVRPSRPPLTLDGELVVSPLYRFSAFPVSDDTSVIGFEVRVDDGEYRPFDAPLSLNREGVRTLTARGIGVDGERGEEAALTLRVDSTPPETAVAIGAARRTEIGSHLFEITLSAEDSSGVDRIEYSLNFAPYTPYEGPIAINSVRRNTLSFRAVDRVGNQSEDRVMVFPASVVTR